MALLQNPGGQGYGFMQFSCKADKLFGFPRMVEFGTTRHKGGATVKPSIYWASMSGSSRGGIWWSRKRISVCSGVSIDRAREQVSDLLGDQLNYPSVIVGERVHFCRIERHNTGQVFTP